MTLPKEQVTNEEIAEKITAYVWEESEYDVIKVKIKEALDTKDQEKRELEAEVERLNQSLSLKDDVIDKQGWKIKHLQAERER